MERAGEMLLLTSGTSRCDVYGVCCVLCAGLPVTSVLDKIDLYDSFLFVLHLCRITECAYTQSLTLLTQRMNAG